MEYKILDAILEAHEAEEIAQDCGLSSEEEGAALWFNEIYYESTWHVDKMPKYNQFVKKIEGGNLYYDYGANYYFLVQENNVNESKNMKNTIRLTESELKNIITESVKNIISELDYKTYINAYKKAEKNGDVRAKKFFDAASDEFNKQYGFDDDEGSFYMDDFEHSDGHNIQWDHYPNGDRKCSPDNHHEFDEFSRPAKLRQKRKDLPQRVKQAEREFANYAKGNYEYTKGKGWHLKDK